jgi:ABC-type multidrug transport system fused ATPase/permease subunit
VTHAHQSSRILLVGIWGHLSRRRRIQLGLLLLVMLASGVAELLSLGAVIPFLAALADTQTLLQQPLLRSLTAQEGWTEANSLLLVVLAATLGFAAAAVLAALVRLLNLSLNSRLAAAIGTDLSCEAYKRTLYQPYAVHVQQNSSTVITATSTQIDLTVSGLNALLQMVTSAVVAVALLGGLLWISPSIALTLMVLFSSAYTAIGIIIRKELSVNGNRIAVSKSQQLKALQEGLGAIRDVLLDGSQATYLQIYREADLPLRQLQGKNQYLGGFPRYALEALGLVAIALVGAALVLQRGSAVTVVPLLGALALGAQRLLPALQLTYVGWATLTGYNAPLKIVLDMLNQPLPELVSIGTPLTLKQSLRLEEVRFRYTPDLQDVLDGVTLEIRHGERVGLIGATGSGKSTTVDLLMGLLKPTQGKILVDGQDLHDPQHPELLNAWRNNIAHVPQSIYLADSSIAENIAFGVQRELIDYERVKLAAKKAEISSFIEASPQGYKSFVGERGIRLSGGQRQRIGIARALYKQASILVLDEATSALDNDTEQAVMDAVYGLNRDLTLVIIAHRLSTLRKCDRVIELANGVVSKEMTANRASRNRPC